MSWILGTCLVLAMQEPASEESTQRIPPVSLSAANGSSLSISYAEDGTLVLSLGAHKHPVKVLFVHFFQADCNACMREMRTLEGLQQRLAASGVHFLGIAHRGDERVIDEVRHREKLTYPIARGVGSEVAKQFARGDASLIVDAKGCIRYSQVGFKDGDEQLWNEIFGEILTGKPVARRAQGRNVLLVGDPMPAIELPELQSGSTISLRMENGQLAFRGGPGKVVHPKAAVGFFSRF